MWLPTCDPPEKSSQQERVSSCSCGRNWRELYLIPWGAVTRHRYRRRRRSWCRRQTRVWEQEGYKWCDIKLTLLLFSMHPGLLYLSIVCVCIGYGLGGVDTCICRRHFSVMLCVSHGCAVGWHISLWKAKLSKFKTILGHIILKLKKPTVQVTMELLKKH